MAPKPLAPSTSHRHRHRQRRLVVATLSASLVSTCAFQAAKTPSLPASTMKATEHRSLPPLIDVDCNLLHPDLASVADSLSTIPLADSDDVPPEFRILHHPSTRLANIAAIVSPSSTVDESEATVKLLQLRSSSDADRILVKTTAGVHPYRCRAPPSPRDLRRLRALLERPPSRRHVSCVGETGLDYSEGFPPAELQREWFRRQLDLAWDCGLPVFLHERKAFGDLLECIDAVAAERRSRGGGGEGSMPKVVVHCFTGTLRECAEYARRGYYVSVSGYIRREGEESEGVRECLREGVVPLDRLMIETDAPYMGFEGNKDAFFDAEGDSFRNLTASKRKKRLKSTYPNVPCALPLVLRKAWEEIDRGRNRRGERRLSLEELATITTENAKNFFRL